MSGSFGAVVVVHACVRADVRERGWGVGWGVGGAGGGGIVMMAIVMKM